MTARPRTLRDVVARALLNRPTLRVYRDEHGRDVSYEVRPRVFGPAVHTPDVRRAVALLEGRETPN